MKKTLTYTLLSFIIFTACSSDSEDEPNFDFSFLVDREWKRVQFNIPTAFDFNLDGVANSNMIDEFDCLENESFTFTSNRQFNYTADGLLLQTTDLDPNSPNYTEQYICDEDGIGTGFFGNFNMLDANTVRIERDPIFDELYENDFIVTLTIVDDRLIRTHFRRHPVSYDAANEVYNYQVIEVEEIFESN